MGGPTIGVGRGIKHTPVSTESTHELFMDDEANTTRTRHHIELGFVHLSSALFAWS